MFKTYKYKLYPNKEQNKSLEQILNTCRNLYNNSLAERKKNKTINYYEQSKKIKTLNGEKINFGMAQDVLRRLEKAFAAHLRKKKTKKGGAPRFKSEKRYNSMTFPSYGNGCKLKNNKIYMQHVGDVKIKLHRQIEGTIKNVTILRQADGWHAIFIVEIEKTNINKHDSCVGIDLGIENFAITSDGVFFPNPKYQKKEEKNIKLLRNKISRCKTSSANQKKLNNILEKKYLKIANQRRNSAHKIAKTLVSKYNFLAIEDLEIKNMIKNNYNSKNIIDAGWSIFIKILTSKAEEAGCKVIKVCPRYTSQTCSNCGKIKQKKLSERQHLCDCGYKAHRDINAAKNILNKALKNIGPDGALGILPKSHV